MKNTNVGNTKTENVLQKENKKPPKKIIEEEDEEIEGDDHELHKKKSKNATEENIEGEQVEQDKNVDKILVEIKPREDYLKEKISKIDIDTKIIGGVTKSLEVALKNFENDIKSNQLLITEITKDLSHLIPKTDTSKTPLGNIINSQARYKLIRELKKRQEVLKLDLSKLTENEKLLENKGYMDLKKSNYIIDENIRHKQLKDIKDNKNKIIDLINDIEYRIQQLTREEKNINANEIKKNNLKDYIANFERDKEIAEIRAKKYNEDYRKKIAQIKHNEKIIKKMIDNESKSKLEKEKEEQKERYEKMKAKIHEMEKNRLEDIKKQLIPLKVYINEKPDKDQYLHLNLKEKYLKKEEKHFIREKSKHKQMMRSIPTEEIDEFNNKLDEIKQKNQEKREENKEKLYELWRSRKELIPSYISPLNEAAENEAHKREKDEELKILRKETYMKARRDYCEQIKEEIVPKISEKLQKEIQDRLNGNKKKKKDTVFDYRKKRIILKKRDPNKKSSRINWDLKLNYVEPEDSDKQKIFVHKPKVFSFSHSFEKKKINLPLKKIDYLAEQKKMKNDRSEGRIRQLFANEEDNKWEKMLKKNKKDIERTVEIVKLQVEKIENEAKQKEQLLKVNGGVANNPELGEKVSNLLIDSIKAKLSIINNLSNK